MCVRHEGSVIAYACVNEACRLEGLFCGECQSEGRHADHTSDWIEYDLFTSMAPDKLDKEEIPNAGDSNENSGHIDN